MGKHDKPPGDDHVHTWQSQGSDPSMSNMVHWQCTGWCENYGRAHAEVWLPAGRHPNDA